MKLLCQEIQPVRTTDNPVAQDDPCQVADAARTQNLATIYKHLACVAHRKYLWTVLCGPVTQLE